MYNPKTDRIKKLSTKYIKTIETLSSIFDAPTAIYIDFANVIHWSDKLKWHVDLKRLIQLFNSFDTVKTVKFYNGTLVGDEKSEATIKQADELGYQVITKPVKKMKLSIDVSSIPKDSTIILQNFIKKPLLKKLEVETVEYLNGKLAELNSRGIAYLEHWKCNFDVEIGRDMYLDNDKNQIENFCLWSGDSDFAEPVENLIKLGKKVVIFSTARRITPELHQTGVHIFEIWKIKEFICWKKEMKEVV